METKRYNLRDNVRAFKCQEFRIVHRHDPRVLQLVRLLTPECNRLFLLFLCTNIQVVRFVSVVNFEFINK